jgi:UDP-N-acetylmuramoyl-L-alanyl-D-glutamate--2,6-diaminopimelate ligase
MKIRKLLEGFDPAVIKNIPVQTLEAEAVNVTADSREVRPGSVFVAVKGTSVDGHAFVKDVAEAGAALLIGQEIVAAKVPFINVKDTRSALSLLAAGFYGNPTKDMVAVGVTGTSGKTTTTYFIESVLAKAGRKVGVIGTINFRFDGKELPSSHTTPGPVELQKLLSEMRGQGCDAVVMEVSSHALKQHRVAGVYFDAMVFSNLSPEHLDYHPDMEDYFQSKAMLFREYAESSRKAGKNPFGAVNGDDPYGVRLLKELKAGGATSFSSYGIGEENDYSGKSLKIDLSGVRGKVKGIAVSSPLTGKFNAYNILAALAALKGLGIGDNIVADGIRSLKCVPGRLERVPNGAGINVIVDYAHKPDALEKVLKTLREVRGSNRLITVFGCGGDRDRTKRPIMGKLAVELSDHVFITSDNPRTENPEGIIKEILVGTAGFKNFSVSPDRKESISAAVRFARPGDLVLIAGKGHEDYQIILDPSQPGKTKKIHFDDREVAAAEIAKITNA